MPVVPALALCDRAAVQNCTTGLHVQSWHTRIRGISRERVAASGFIHPRFAGVLFRRMGHEILRVFALFAGCRYGGEPAYAQGSGEAGFAAPKPSAKAACHAVALA